MILLTLIGNSVPPKTLRSQSRSGRSSVLVGWSAWDGHEIQVEILIGSEGKLGRFTKHHHGSKAFWYILLFLRYTIDSFFRPKLSSAVAPSKLTSWFMHSNIPDAWQKYVFETYALLPWVDMPLWLSFPNVTVVLFRRLHHKSTRSHNEIKVLPYYPNRNIRNRDSPLGLLEPSLFLVKSVRGSSPR